MSDSDDDEDLKVERWREQRLRTCLRFFVLDNQSKVDYLPPSFPELTFHLDNGGDLTTGEPLKFICSLPEDVYPGCPSYPDAINQRIREVLVLLDLMYWSKDECIWNLSMYTGQSLCRGQWTHLWDILGRLSKEALTLLGWAVEPPDLSCETLLDEYSYGAYSAVVHSRLSV